MNIKIDINVCRVCLQTGSGISLFNEFSYAEKFQYCTLLEVNYTIFDHIKYITKFYVVTSLLHFSIKIYKFSYEFVKIFLLNFVVFVPKFFL